MTIIDGATDFEIAFIEVERVNHVCLLCALDWKHPFQACQDNATQLHPRFCNSSFHNNIVIGAVASWIKRSAWMVRCIAASPLSGCFANLLPPDDSELWTKLPPPADDV